MPLNLALFFWSPPWTKYFTPLLLQTKGLEYIIWGKNFSVTISGFFYQKDVTSKSGNSTASYFCITLISVKYIQYVYFSNLMTNYQFGSKIHNWHVFCSASYLPAMGLNDKWYVHCANAVSLRCDYIDERPARNWTFHLKCHNAFSRENLNRK